MSGNATVFSIGGVSVSASGAMTGAILDQLNNLYGPGGSLAGDVVTVPATGANPTLPAPTGPNELLVIPGGDTGTINIPDGYAYVVYSGTGSLTGGTGTFIVGDLNYSGGAPSVLASDPTNSIASNINDTAAGAQIILSGGANNAVVASGSGDAFTIDGAGSGTVTATGAGDTFNMAGGSYLLYALGGATVTQSAGSSTVVASVAAVDMNASGGNVAFFAGTSADSVATSGSTTLTFLGGGGIDTLTGQGSADTVYAGSAGLVYQGGSGSDLFVAGPTSNVTLTGAAQETIYGNAGTSTWDLSNTSQAYFGAGGGNDNVTLGATAAASIWGNNNESLSISGGSGTPAGTQIVAFGEADNINLSGANGGNAVLMWNAELGTQAFTGNTTLVASSAGNDSVVMFSASQFGASPGPAHTITVSNWQASDVFDLSFAQDSNGNYLAGYTAADAASATTQLAAGSSFTLSDGTTVVFQGAKPTTIAHI